MIVIALDLLLAGLLAAALILGWRLNQRLGALRASQLDFARAVSELDSAAARAEAGLTALRAASDEAHDSLLSRIDTARALAARLEKAEASAEGAARRAEAAAAEAKAAPPAPMAQRPPSALRDALARVESGSPESINRESAHREPAHRAPQRRETAQARPTPRRRPIADETLFADPDEGLVRSGLQGLLRMSLSRR
jgi:hypothetical protein